ncbi:GtrA family protein [Pararhodobacter sp. CCB-MM2]|uniref:GtrA family protein n=1 Tax=Pararhodobacter sp. CCB-MM2 TaxID=1786003 RepID=UPI0009F39315
MVTGWTLLIRYSAFAIVATIANLGAQRAVLTLGEGPLLFTLAIIAGTGLGLVVKYILDKRWIFADTETGVKAHGKKFSLYTAMGLVTTAIFWGAETLAWALTQSHEARELGAVIGLAIGYVVKYQLDRRFVFARPEAVPCN